MQICKTTVTWKTSLLITWRGGTWFLISPAFADCLLISLLPVVQKQVSMGICCVRNSGAGKLSFPSLLALLLLSSSPFHNKDTSVIFLNIQKRSFAECSRVLPKLLLPNQQLFVSAGSEGKKGLGGVMQTLCGVSGVCEGRQITYWCFRSPSSDTEKLHSALLFPSVFKWDIKLSFNFNWCSY